MPERRWFICAIWSSASKSETARRPLTIASTSWSRAKSTSNPLKNSMRMLVRCWVASFSICWRSSRLNSDCVFWGFRITATITSSKCRDERSMMSRWPRVTGSNDPGQRAVVTQSPPVAEGQVRETGSEEQEGQKRISERPLPAVRESRRNDDGMTHRSFAAQDALRREPPRRQERHQEIRDVGVGSVVRRVDEHKVER